MNNEALARLIFSLGQYEGYNTSLLQTEKNLSSKPENQEFASEDDRYIFDDLVKAINYASSQNALTVDVVKGINASMDSRQKGQPEAPGILRNNVPISVGDYVPRVTVTEQMVQRQLDSVTATDVSSAWELYARLAKLQPFDNGNKRTALIAANLLHGSFTKDNKDYLVIPMDYRKARFDANLIDYYMADDWDDHLPDEAESLFVFVDFATKLTMSTTRNV
jgi:hypothetical protein